MRCPMPELSSFFGVVIKMYWDDHSPSHFYAFYAGEQALIDITSLRFLLDKELKYES